MHLVIGAIASTLLAGSRFGKGATDRPLSFWGVLEVRHEIPGRIRFNCPSVHRNPEGAALVDDQLHRLPGIEGVRSDVRSGSIVVTFEADRIDARTIQAGILKLLGLEEAAEHPSPSVLTRETNEILGSINRAILEVSRGTMDLDFLIPTALMTLATVRLAQGAGLGMPEGFTLLWWAFAYLSRHGSSS